MIFQQRGDRNSWNGTSRCDFYDDNDDDDDDDKDDDDDYDDDVDDDDDDDDNNNNIKVRLLRLQRDK